MAFTYSDALIEDRDKVRLKIGDTVSGAGPRPDKRNFSNEEIAFFLDDEGAVNAAIAAAFETLAGEWAAWALVDREGEVEIDAKEVAAGYREQAKTYRKKPGGDDGGSSLEAGTIDLAFAQVLETSDDD